MSSTTPLELLVDTAAKGVIVLLLTTGIVGLMHRTPAALRYLVWSLGLHGLLLLPVISLLLPSFRVNLLPSRTAVPEQVYSSIDRVSERLSQESPGVNELPEAPSVGGPSLERSNQKLSQWSATGGYAGNDRSDGTRVSWTQIIGPTLIFVWLAGVVLALIPLAFGLGQLMLLRVRSSHVKQGSWQTALNDLCKVLQINRRVRLMQNEQLMMPLTWGGFRPVLLIPAEAHQWTSARRQMVLLHELGHIRRWDWMTQLTAYFVCAVHWFNPLVWIAARRMRSERELACDDIVLTSGARASDYARELLQLAAEVARVRQSAFFAVPMARGGVLENRLRSVLDTARDRRATTKCARCVAMMLAVTLILPLAAVRLSRAEGTTDNARAAAETRATATPLGEQLPAPGVSGELVALKQQDSAAQPAANQADNKADKRLVEKAPARTVTVRGKAVDDATGEPIPVVVTQAGKFDPADPTKVTWGYSEARYRSSDGSFSCTVRWEEGWTARILADGYYPQPVINSAPPLDKDELEVTIRLKRGRNVRGVVLDHSGAPLKGAAVFNVYPTPLNLAAGQAWRSDGVRDDGPRPATTDDQGRFELPAGGSDSVAVSHAQFDLWSTKIPDTGEISIRLPRPARLELALDIDGAAKEGVIFYQLLTEGMPEFAGVQCEREIKISNPGKLTLPALPPGKYQLGRYVINHLKQFSTAAFLERQFFELQAGEVKRINFVRPQGARARGSVTWPEVITHSGVIVSIRKEKAERDPFTKHEWTMSYSSQTTAADGSFLTERVSPGTYVLRARAYPQLSQERLGFSGVIRPSWRAEVKIEVPMSGELTVPELMLEPIPPGEQVRFDD